MKDNYIFYEFNGERYKIPTEKKGDFERMAPTAKVMMTFKGENYGIPLTEINSFVNKAGANNVTYSAFDDKKKYSPDNSTLGFLEDFKSTSVDVEDNNEDKNSDIKIDNEVYHSLPKELKKPDAAYWQAMGETVAPAQSDMDFSVPYSFEKDKTLKDPTRAEENIEQSIFNSHAEHTKNVDDYIAMVDNEYYAKKAKEPEKGFLQKLGESMMRAQDESFKGGTSYQMEELKEDADKGQDYRYAKIAKNISERVDEKINQYNNPAETFVEGVGEGIRDAITDLETWDSTIGAKEAAIVYDISKKHERGEELTAGEQMIVDALVDELATDVYFASGFGRGYKAGKVTGESIPFMLETFTNPASGLGKSITKKFGKGIYKAVRKKLGKALAKSAVYATRVGGDIAGANIMSATTSQNRVIDDALGRLTGHVDFDVNEDGILEFDGFSGGEDSAFKAYAKAYGANTIEHYSEMIGNYFSPLGKMTKKGAAGLADKVGFKKVKSFLTDSPTGFGAFVSDFAEQSQIGGPIGEFAEEVIGGALNAITVGDQSLKKYDENGNLNQNWLFDKDNMIDTFLGVSILGGAMSGAQVIGYKTPEARFDKAINDAKANLRKVASIDDMQKLEAFALNPMGVESANLIPFFDESRSPEYKRTVGEYISAVMQKQGYNISKRADLSGTKQGMREMMDAYKVGQNMSEADLYDVSDAEAKAQQALVDSGFLDVAGEEGADAMQQALGSSSYELFTLADKLERENGIILDDKQRAALKNLSLTRNTKEGLENKLSGYRDMAITANNVISSGAAQDGVLTVGFHNGKKVYVKGDVKLSNGSIVKPSDIGSYPVEIVDAMTGDATSVESGEVSNVENIDIVDYNNAMANIISTSYAQRWEDWRNKKSAKSKLAEVEQFVGQKVFINTPDGKMAEVEVQQILPNGEVLIKGKKGDLGQTNIRVDVDSFYDSMSRDADGNPIFNQSEFRSQSANIKAAQDRMYNLGQQGSTVGATTAQPTAPVAQAEEGVPVPAQTTDTEVEVSEEDDFRGEIIPILINGVPVEVEVISQDGPSNTIVYEYEDENGNTKRGKTTIGGFKAAAQQAQNYVPETPAVETPVAEVDTEVPATEVPTTETPVSEVPLKPEDIDWDVLFEQYPESYFLELQKQFGDKTATMLNAVIAATQSELESLNKAKPKTQNEIFANEAQKEVLQSKIDVLNGMLERLNATEAPVVETPAAPEVPETETPVAETPTTPEVPTTETPIDNVPNNGTPSNTAPEETPSAETPKFVAPEGGFIMEDGFIINPIVIEMPGVEGESNKIYLAEKDGKWGANWLVVLDNGSSFGYRSNPKIQKEWLVHDTPEKAIADALKFFDYIRKDKSKMSSSKKIDDFMQWAYDTYLKEAGIEIPSTFVPEAPTPVENPIQEAKKKEKSLATQLKRYDLSHELKQDLAFKAGKAVADFFATREEYDDYAESATDFGEYNADFERGVDESFANRQQNAGNSPVNSVPLENQPKGENNGESGAKDETSGNGPSVPDNSGRTTNEGAEGGNQTAPKVGKGKTNKGKTGKQVDKYPARKGNATQKMLVDTFGFNKVEIPNSRKETLNTIYDFMMAMSKMLGISPTSIGQGGWLDVGSLRSNAQSSAEHSLRSKTLDQSIVKATIKYKYATLTGLAHEWWHALDHALSYFETGKGNTVASELPNSRFTGRQETWYAVNQVIRAIKDSGHENRMHTLKFPLRYVNYLTENTEMAARAFDEYIKAKFAEAGIVIENATDTNFVTQPTAEEMAVITPAFDNLFNVLQEKEGKNPGTTVLFHIGEQMEPGSDAWKLVTESVLEALNNAKIDVTRVSDEEARQMIAVASELTGIEMMTVYHGSPHKFSAFDHSKMGTGEGAQAHGWGTYVARNKETGVDYAKTLRRGTPKIKRNGLDVSSNVRVSVDFAKTPLELVATAIDWYGVDRAKAQINFGLQEAEKKFESDPASMFSDALEAKVELYKNALALFNSNSWETEENPAHLYTVEIPEDTGSNYLSETAYTDTQIEKISDACNKEGIDFLEVAAISSESSDSRDGARLYNALIQVLGSDKAASEFLSRAGFSGIKYIGNQDGPCFVIFNETDAKITGYTELCQTPDGIVYGWTNGKKIFLTEAGMNPNTPIHEYTHIWARAMMQKNPKGWNSIKKLLKGTPVWNDVINDPNYSNISNDEDAVASEALSRISGSENAAKMEYMAQKMIDEAKSTGRKLEASGLIQNMRDALNRFWEFVWKDLFGMTNFRSVEQVTDRVLFDLLNGTDLGELSEAQVETQIVTDPKVIAELEASPKVAGFRNVVQNEDGTFSSPMAYWLQSTKEGSKSRVETAKFELGKWEEAEEHPELVDDNGKVTLVKPNKSTVDGVAYDPYIHNRLEPVNLQFKDAWKRDDLVYVETEVAENDLNEGYHADKALLPVGIHSWSNGDVMLSRYDKPVRVMAWEEVADAWAKRLNGKGVHFDVVPPAMRSLLVERGVEILPPHKGMGKDCNDAYKAWKDSVSENNSLTSQSYENTEDEYATNDSRGISSETEGVQGEVSMSGPLSEERRLYNPEGEGVSWDAYASFNPINEREGESYNRRNLRETRFFETFEKLTSDERLLLYTFLNEYLPKNSGALKSKAEIFIEPIRKSGNTALADFVEDFINDELKYREGVSASTVAKHGLIVGASYNTSILKQIFAAYNNDTYNEALFNRALQLAKRFGVTVKFATRGDNGSFINVYGSYNPNDNSITLDANLLTNGNEVELCQTIVHELIHSVVARATSIMSGRAINNNNEFIDPQSLPKDVIDGINTLKEVYDAIKDDESFKTTYGATSAEEMLSEISDPKFRGLLKAKNLWKKFLNGICKILGIKDSSATESDALTEVESALDKIFQSAERGELDDLYAGFLGQLAEGYTLEDLQNLGSGPVKSLLTQNKLFKTGIDPTKLASESARQVYDYNVSRTWNEFQRQFQDAMQPVRVAIDAIQQATGNVPIEDYENYILVQNQSSSRSRVEIDEFSRNYYTPVINQVNAVIDSIMQARGWKLKDKKKRSQVYAEVRQYLIAKHGLERNEYYQSHNLRKLNAWEKQRETAAAQKEYDDKVNVINNDTTLSDTERELQLRDALDELNAAIEEIKTREVPDIRDYSGLTSLFGMEPKLFREAEAEAEKLVEKFETEAGPVTEEMWKKINAATDKTLRHSYESGMISRQQYNDIKAMFEFYVPLRGFDETTAEDVYSYARFEGNRFNPAVQTAKGRTSVADDPIAIIMNMAESEIAQGNKNRAKQALYNYLLNRSEGKGTQNSLMQIESVWYVKAVDANGNETLVIAAPDHENGETYEEFEARMNLLAAEDKAAKSKKGHVDVGVRFQKQMNRNAHYVYLKVNGVDKAIYVNGDPKAADAINGVYAKPKGTLEEKMGTVNRFISSTFTNYSLEFTARNYFRDMIYSHINIDVRESDSAYRKKFRQNWRHNNLATMLKMLNAYRAGKYNDVPLNEDQAAFVEFMQNGGQTGYTIINSVENRKKELENAIERMQKGLEKGGVKDSTVFKFTLGAIEMLNEASELVTRFAAFKTSRDMGRGVVKAISDAKEITVNFNTKGAQDGKGLMGGVARYFGWSKFFFNASVQGVQNIAAMARANKLKFGTVAGGMVAFGFVMPIITSVISNMLGGDDDEYWNIPEYDRQNNVCIVLGGGKYAKIPLPIAFRELYGIGDMVAAWAFNKKFMRDGAQVGMDAASKIATIVLPINPIEGSANGLSAWETFLYTSLPSSFQFAVQNATNTDWKGAPLQKEYTYNEDDPQWMKAFKSNPDWMVGISKWCNEHIGTGDYKGWDWSPEKLDNTLSNMFGGMYSLIKKTGKTISMAWNEEERNLSNVPLAGVIVGSGIDSNERYVNDAYFTEKEYYDERIGSIKRIAKKFGYDLKDVFINGEGKHRPKMIKDIYGKKDFDFMQEWYLGHEGNPEGMTDAENWGLDKMKQEIKKIEKEINKYEDDPPQELIEELNRLNKEFESYRRELVEDLMELD